MIKDILKKYDKYIYAFCLIIMCLMMYFLHLSDYIFIDNSETKFVSVVQEMFTNDDWFNVKLNGERVLDIAPLFCWFADLFCFVFGKISSSVMRIPCSVIITVAVIIVFRVLKNILTPTYAFMIAAISATGFGIIIYSHLATSDIASAVFVMLSVLFSQRILLDKSEKKSGSFLAVYIFAALAGLCSGIIGTFIAFITIILMNIFSGNLKKFFSPKNSILGVISFLLIVLPFIIIMIKQYGFDFFKENFYLCNFMKTIGLKQVIFVLLFFVIGFLPWSFSFIWSLGSKYKDIFQNFISYFKDNSEDKLKEKWNKLNKINKFISLNIIFFFTVFTFSLLYGSKNIYIILLLIFPASSIAGYYWYQYTVRKEHNKSIFFATIIPDLILIGCSLAGIFGHNAINTYVIRGLNNLIIPLVLIFFVIPVISIFAVMLKNRKIPFVANIVLMFSLSFVITPDGFNLYGLNTGTSDLISFSGIAIEKNIKTAAYLPEKKYSLVYYYDEDIVFLPYGDLQNLKNYINTNPQTQVIVEIKDMNEIEKNSIKYMLLDSGKRYCVIKKLPPEFEKTQYFQEPAVIVY